MDPFHADFAEVEQSGAGVGGFLGVLESVPRAVVGNAGGVIDAEAPAEHVEGVNAVVAEFAVAPVPEPVPVVMHVRFDVAFVSDGSLPKVEVEVACWFDGLLGDGFARGVIEGAREKHLTDGFFGAQVLDGFFHPRAALVSHLHEALMLSRRGDDEFCFERVLAAGLFDEHVFTGLHGEHCGGRVPEVGGSDKDSVEGFVIEEAAEIFHALAGGGLFGRDDFQPIFKPTRIYFCYVGDFGVWTRKDGVDVGHPATERDDGAADFFAGCAGRADGGEGGDKRGHGGGGGRFKKRATG